MRIAIFTDTYYPDINGVVSSIGILRNELMKHGHQVLIITTIPPLGVHMEDDPFIIRMNGITLKSIYGYRMAGIYNNKIFLITHGSSLRNCAWKCMENHKMLK